MNQIKYVSYHGPTDNISDKIHFHANSTEIWQITKGSGLFLIDGVPFQIQNNMIVFIGPMNLHCVQLKNTPTPDISRMSINYDFFEKITVLLGLSNYILPLFETRNGIILSPSEPIFNQIDDLFREINEATSSDSSVQQGKALLNVLQFIILCIEETTLHSRYSAIKSSDDTFSRILEKINFNISSPDLSLEFLSKELYLSKFYICKIFKKHLNLTFSEYVIDQRIALAKMQLIQTDHKCSEIAESCGFSSFSFFSRKFQEAEGVTATQYRKKKREQQKSTEQK